MMLEIVITSVWLVCGVFAYGGTIAHFCKEYGPPYDAFPLTVLALIMLLIGPLGLFVTVVNTGFFEYGLLFRVPKDPLP